MRGEPNGCALYEIHRDRLDVPMRNAHGRGAGSEEFAGIAFQKASRDPTVAQQFVTSPSNNKFHKPSV